MKKIALAIALVALCSPFELKANGVNLTATVLSTAVCGNNVREAGEQCDGPDLGSGTCSDLGFSGGTLSCTPGCLLDVSNCSSAAANTFITSFTASLGGTMDLTDATSTEASVTVPPDVYFEDLSLIVFSNPGSSLEATAPAPAGYSFVGKAYDFNFVSAEGTIVHSLFEPVTVVLHYSADDLADLDESSLIPYVRHEGDTEWHAVTPFTLDPVVQTVTFASTAFSTFTILGKPVSNPLADLGSSLAQFFGHSSGISSGVTFHGQADPGSTLTLLRDGQAVADAKAGKDGRFSFFFMTLIPGNYVFALYATLPDGTRTPLRSLSVSVNPRAITDVSGISLAMSSFPADMKPIGASVPADLNRDGAVNLVDFSILAYWYGRPHPPASIDLSGDGKVDLSDFSIMAYYWTD